MENQQLELGQSVAYIRSRGAEVLEGSGVVRALLIDHTGRKVAQIFDLSQPAQQQVFNVDLKSVNPSDEHKAKFRELVAFVFEHSNEGNAESQRIVSEYNARIDAKLAEVLGEPVDLGIFKGAPAPNTQSLDAPANSLAA